MANGREPSDVVMVGLNPSQATARNDDPTIRAVQQITQTAPVVSGAIQWGRSNMVIPNSQTVTFGGGILHNPVNLDLEFYRLDARYRQSLCGHEGHGPPNWRAAKNGSLMAVVKMLAARIDKVSIAEGNGVPSEIVDEYVGVMEVLRDLVLAEITDHVRGGDVDDEDDA